MTSTGLSQSYENAHLDLDGHNPDSQCLACCEANIRLEKFLDTLEGLLTKITDPKAIDELPPMLKMMTKFLPK